MSMPMNNYNLPPAGRQFAQEAANEDSGAGNPILQALISGGVPSDALGNPMLGGGGGPTNPIQFLMSGGGMGGIGGLNFGQSYAGMNPLSGDAPMLGDPGSI